jgi:hypothetical protein
MSELAKTCARKGSDAALDVEVVRAGTKSEFRGGRWRLAADHAEVVLREPLLVITENARCDGAFLRKIALRVGERALRRTLGDAGFERLRRLWSDPLGDGERLRVIHGGGDTTATQVELAANGRPEGPRRILVLVDSDRDTPAAEPGQTAKKVMQVVQEVRQDARQRHLELHMLCKREVENYLPSEVLRQKRRDGFKGWEQLSEQERDHVDLKERFGRDLWKTLEDPQLEKHFHENALRDRGGAELDELVRLLVKLL